IFELSVRETNDYIDRHLEKWGEKYGLDELNGSIAILKEQYERQATVLLDENELDQQDIDAPDLDTAQAEKPRLSGPQLTSLRRELIGYRRSIVLRQRNSGELDEEVMRSVLRGLDAEELALDTSTVTRNRS
ncbi:MAG: monovalent cation/hydrogen antiporter, partial [Subtercola sp.]|nr:monovalent cation/hydrogen antiporter [Subtercola sp.]